MNYDTYKTRDGRIARIYATDGYGDYPVHGAIWRDDGWVDTNWTPRGECMRVYKTADDLIDYPRKAWKLPEPPAGQKWHRDDWTEEMLPEGYRPLLLGEMPKQGDEIDSRQGTFVAQTEVQLPHQRTKRPLPTPKPETFKAHGHTWTRHTPKPETFKAHGHTWTRHTPGDPMPCDGSALIHVLLEGVPGYNRNSVTANSRDWGKHNDPVFYPIIGWRYAEEPDPYAELKAAHAAGKVIQVRAARTPTWLTIVSVPRWTEAPSNYRVKPELKRVPLTAEDVPPGSVSRNLDRNPRASWVAIRVVHQDYVKFFDRSLAWETMMAEGWEIKRPGQDWQPCWKEVEDNAQPT